MIAVIFEVEPKADRAARDFELAGALKAELESDREPAPPDSRQAHA